MASRSVAELCEERSLTPDQLTEISGLDPHRVLAIMLARWTPSPAERAAIAGALEVDITDITWGHKTPIQHIYGQGPG
jgi:hypothetical protein